MSLGKSLSILGGVIIILTTIFLSFIVLDYGGNTYYIYGIGTTKNISNIFSNSEALASATQLSPIAVILLGICLIWFLSSEPPL